MSATVIDSQPKRSSVPLDHGGRSVEEIAEEYFSWMNPIGRKIVVEKRTCMDSHRRDWWERLTQKEKDSILNEWFIDPKARLRYELKLGTKTASAAKGFPRLRVEGGQKVVHYSEHDDASQTKETVSWKDEFSGPFCWETKCQQELTILTSETISAASISSPSISHDLIKVSDPDVETDAEWFAKSHKDKNKLSVMLMRDVSNRGSFGSNLLGSSTERLAFDQAVSATTAGKPPVPKEKPSGASGSEKGSGGESSLERRKKTKEPTKPKMPPPVSAKQNTDGKEHDRKAGSGGKGKDKKSFPSSPRQNSGSRNTEMASPRRNSGSKKKATYSEKKQLLPAGLLTELKQELKVQDNVNFDPGRKEEEGQGDGKTQELAPVDDAATFEFLFDW